MKLNWSLLVTLFLSFIILGVFLVGIENIDQVISNWEEEVAIVAFLKEGLSPGKLEELYNKIMVQEGVEEIVYISKEKALEKFLKEEALEIETNILGENPLPASLLIKTTPKSHFTPVGPGTILHRLVQDIVWFRAGQTRRIKVLKEISERIAGYPEIEEVDYGGREAGALFRATSLFRMVGLTLGVILTLGLLLVASLLFRLTLPKERIERLKEKGKNIWMIRGELLGQGILEGLFTSLAALGILSGIYHLLILGVGGLSFMNLRMALGLVGTGLVFGLLGNLFSWRAIK